MEKLVLNVNKELRFVLMLRYNILHKMLVDFVFQLMEVIVLHQEMD